MDALNALAQARTEFETRLRQVDDNQWDAPTPCPDWNVRQLVNHILLGNRMTVQLLGGATSSEVIAGLDDDLIGSADDVVTSFVSLADELHAGFAADGGLDGTVDHPMGQIPRSVFIGFRVCDYGAHAWDLARGIDADDELDGELVQWMWQDIQPLAGGLAGLGIFGTGSSGAVPDDAPLQTRYLDLIGRRP